MDIEKGKGHHGHTKVMMAEEYWLVGSA